MAVRTLVLCEDCAHPASLTIDGLDGLGEGGYAFDYVSDPKDWSPERMAGYPLVVFSKANQTSDTDRTPWVTEETGQAFVDYVRRGKGLLFLHSGTALYKEIVSMRDLMGGVFVGHPPQCDVMVAPKAGHVLTEGTTTFTVCDEHYMMEMHDTNVDLFLHTSSEHGEMPAGWRRRESDGRVAVLTPGHNPEGWMVPAYQALLRNCLNWCSGAGIQN